MVALSRQPGPGGGRDSRLRSGAGRLPTVAPQASWGVPSRSAPRSLVSPVGRAELLDAALASLDAGGSVLVLGPAGIGKSTLLAALTDRADRTHRADRPHRTDRSGAGRPGAPHAGARQAGTRVLRAAAAEVESGLPY